MSPDAIARERRVCAGNYAPRDDLDRAIERIAATLAQLEGAAAAA